MTHTPSIEDAMKRLFNCALGMFVALNLAGCFSLLNENSSAKSKVGAAAVDIVTLPVQAATVVGLTVTAPFHPKPSSKSPPPATTRTHRFNDGSLYEGTANLSANGRLPDGHGRYTRPDGTDLSGKFAGGYPSEVRGTVVFLGGLKMAGEWNGRGKGRGTMSWHDGVTYSGEWALAFDSGNVSSERGIGDDGETMRLFRNLRSVPDGTGTKTWPDGRKYEGGWHQGRMHGRGQMTLPDGTVQKGVWQGDKFVGP